MRYKNVKFLVVGTINGKVEVIIYEYKHRRGKAIVGRLGEFMLKNALERITPVGPQGMYLKRNINDPLAMLSILTSDEIFEEVIKVDLISGVMPEAPDVPEGAIC